MSTVTVAPGHTIRTPGQRRLLWALSDVRVLTWRYVLNWTRVPESLFFSSVQPIMFVLLFRYVFAGEIHIPGFDYVNYLMPGIFVQSLSFGAVGTAVALAEDLQKGLIERFRSLPMTRSAVLAGRTSADLLRATFVLVLLTLVGLAVGFRPSTGVGPYLGGFAILLLFSYSLNWTFAVIGLTARNSEVAQLMSFPVLLPLTFASSAFVQVSSMPGWLQAFAAHQPVTIVVDAARGLMVGGPTATYVLQALAWCVGILLVMAPLAVWRFRKAV